MPTTIEEFKKAFSAVPQSDAAKLFVSRHKTLTEEVAKLEKSPYKGRFVVDVGYAKTDLELANADAQKGAYDTANETLDTLTRKVGALWKKNAEAGNEEAAWKVARGKLVDAMVAADQSHSLLVDAFGKDVPDVAKDSVKAIQSLNANLAGADKLALTDKPGATKVVERFTAEAEALVKGMQPEAEKAYQERRKPVQKAIDKLAKHPQFDLLKDEHKAAEAKIAEADNLAKAGKYKSALDKLHAADDIASSANACDLSKPEKKAIFEELKKAGDPAKALAVAAVTTAKGTATKEDAVEVAKETAKLPVSVLRRLNAKGATVVAARGNVPDVIPSLKGVHPNGWPPTLTWDNVPGVYDPDTKQIVAATYVDGGKHKVLETNTTITVGGKSVNHGSFSVVLHEAGHGLDFNGYNDGKEELTPELSSKALFTSRRNKDVTANKIQSPRDDYFLQGSPWGERETFAESTARHFGNDSKFAGDWPETAKFWQAKPWGIGSV